MEQALHGCCRGLHDLRAAEHRCRQLSRRPRLTHRARAGPATSLLAVQQRIHERVPPVGPRGPLLRQGDWNAWPRSKRKGSTQPKHRADIKGNEGLKGAHTIDKHVGKTDTELRARLRDDPNIAGSSTFRDEADAQRFTDAAMLDKQSEVSRWLDGGKGSSKVIEVEFGEVTGRSLSREDFIRGSGPHDVQSVRLVLRRDPDLADGFRIQTSFPTP
ncbi:RNase A-like domain-containing protein [Streptomyces sp. NPDC048639]|uniref:RNase A-like domain-containing protein n=1 Tax=Streptomyces sp. NPDC048639 TaxID=3365581 RepID=UPI0037171216